jgi:hypothetical protein
MVPVLAIVGLGRKRRVLIPFPFFLLWPLLLVGGLVFGAFPRKEGVNTRAPGYFSRVSTALAVFWHLSGLWIDIRSNDGSNIYLRFI